MTTNTTEQFTQGTSSSRGYNTVRHGWLDPTDAFLSRTSVRGWPRGGSAEHPSTLLIISGDVLALSWDRCVAALRSLDVLPVTVDHFSWVDTFGAEQLSRLLDRTISKGNDAHLAALSWVTDHILTPWRLRETMRIHRGWSLREANIDPMPGLVRVPEEVMATVLDDEPLRIDVYGAACKLTLTERFG